MSSGAIDPTTNMPPTTRPDHFIKSGSHFGLFLELKATWYSFPGDCPSKRFQQKAGILAEVYL